MRHTCFACGKRRKCEQVKDRFYCADCRAFLTFKAGLIAMGVIFKLLMNSNYGKLARHRFVSKQALQAIAERNQVELQQKIQRLVAIANDPFAEAMRKAGHDA